MVSDIRGMLRSQQGASCQPQSVSATCTLPIAEHTLTVAQTQNRSEFRMRRDTETYIHV